VLSRLLLHFLTVDVLRESVCDCFHEILSKGMDPVAKTELVESLVRVLENAGILSPSEVSIFNLFHGVSIDVPSPPPAGKN